MTTVIDPGRTALLVAGIAVAEREGLQRLSVNSVVEEAGMAKGTFYRHFANRRSYVVALHRRFYDDLGSKVAAALAGIPTGKGRLRTSIDAFLDACLATRGAEAFLTQARGDHDLIEEMLARRERLAAAGKPDLAAVGWSDPGGVALLKVAMMSEISLFELRGRRPRPDLRMALYRLLTAEIC